MLLKMHYFSQASISFSFKKKAELHSVCKNTSKWQGGFELNKISFIINLPKASNIRGEYRWNVLHVPVGVKVNDGTVITEKRGKISIQLIWIGWVCFAFCSSLVCMNTGHSVLWQISSLCKHLNNHMSPAILLNPSLTCVQVRVNGGDRQSERGLEITVVL